MNSTEKLEKHFTPDYNGKNIYKWLSEDTTVPYVKLDIDIPYIEIYKEVMAIKDYFVVHRETEGDGSWKSLCLHGIDSHYTNDWQYYDEFKNKPEPEYNWTSISKQCPLTTEFFKKTFPYKDYKRLRFMWIEPGGYILPHQDLQQRHLAPVNVSIYNPIGCEFRYKNWGTVPFTHGSAFLVDVGQPHAVWNRSNEPRIHIIAHGSKDWNRFLPMLEQSWKTQNKIK